MSTIPSKHSVDPVTRELNSTSVSALQKFNPDEEGGCNRRWWFKYVERLPEQETSQQGVGKSGHSQVEHYLETGEDVLGPIAAAGRHLLPAPGSDLLVEFGLNGKPKPKVKPGEKETYPSEESLVRADGVPLIGFADWINPRGTYVSPEGILLQDPPNTVEVGDNKFSSSLKYAKTRDDLLKSTQMIGYAESLRALFSGLEHARVSHVVFQTRDQRAAKKTTVLIPVASVIITWQKVGHEIAKKMREVAFLRRESDVPANLCACRSYNKLCDFSNNCSAYKNQKPLDRLKSTVKSLSPTPAKESNTVTNPLLNKVRGINPGAPANGAPIFAAPGAPPGQVQTLFAKDAVAGAGYKFSTGWVGMFLSAIEQNGQVVYSFIGVDAAGKTGGTPYPMAATEVIELVFNPPAPAAPPAPPAAAAPTVPPANPTAGGPPPWNNAAGAPLIAAAANPPVPPVPTIRRSLAASIVDTSTPTPPSAPPAAEAPVRGLGKKAGKSADPVERAAQVAAAVKAGHELYASLYDVQPTAEQAVPFWQALLG